MLCTLPMGIIPFLLGSIFNCILVLFINTFYTGKLINVGFFIQMKDILPVVVLSAIVALLVYIVTLFVHDSMLQILFGLVFGTSIYYLCAKFLNFSEIEDVKYMLSKKK